MHNPSLLGFSLLLLSCASPTLGAPAEPNSTPSSPALGFSFNPSFNPGEPVSIPGTPLLSPTAAASPSDASTTPTGSLEVSTPSTTEVIAAAVTPSAPSVSSVLATAQSLPTPGPDGAAQNLDAEANHEAPLATQSDTEAETRVAVGSGLPVMKHSKASSAAHKKIASKLKFIASASSPSSLPASSSMPATSAHKDFATSQPVPTSSSVPSALFSADVSQPTTTSDFVEPLFSTTRSIVQPTGEAVGDPHADDVHSQSQSDASERARRTAIVAAFLILATLGALGGGVLCFKCGVLPCCHNKARQQRKSRASLAKAEEGQGMHKLTRAASIEKSIIPGAPPQVDTPVADMPILSRDSHTPSCSTCPDSLVGMKSGISGGASSSSWRVYATNEDGQYEDVTHVLASDTYSTLRSGHSRYASAASAESGTSSGTEPQSSAHSHSRTASRASGRSESGASMTAESYKSCESRYSTPSFERRSRDGPPSASASASSSFLHSPSPPVSVLLLTPEQADYAGLADAALPCVLDVTAAPLETVAESEGEDMELDSQWDVAQTFGVPAQQKAHNTGIGRGTPAKAEQAVGTVAVGGRTCMLMRG